jgi:hypothetical protein
MKSFLNGLKSLTFVAALMASSGTAQALTYQAPPFQGLTFTVTTVDANTFTFRIQGNPSPDWEDANFLDAFSFKDLGLDFTTTTATANGPGATNLAGVNFELNNSGGTADCSNNGGGKGSICFDFMPDTPLITSPDNVDMTYTIDFSNPFSIAAGGPHLKIAFTEVEDGKKVGSFFSDELPLTTGETPGETPGKVPEPAGLILLGTGLLAIAGAAKKLKRKN